MSDRTKTPMTDLCRAIVHRDELIQAMARTLEDCRTRIVGYDFDTAALQARIGELLARAEKCK